MRDRLFDPMGLTSMNSRHEQVDETRAATGHLIRSLDEGPIVTRGARHYALTLRPWLWLMSQRQDCRIFLGQSTAQAVETL